MPVETELVRRDVAQLISLAEPLLCYAGTNEVAKRTLSNMLGGLGYSAGHPIIGLPDKSVPGGGCCRLDVLRRSHG